MELDESLAPADKLPLDADSTIAARDRLCVKRHVVAKSQQKVAIRVQR